MTEEGFAAGKVVLTEAQQNFVRASTELGFAVAVCAMPNLKTGYRFITKDCQPIVVIGPSNFDECRQQAALFGDAVREIPGAYYYRVMTD